MSFAAPPPSRFLARRLGFLAASNAVLLVCLYLRLEEGASFESILGAVARDAGPVLLAALGLTGIIAAGAIDLSIGSIIAVSGSVFGILIHREATPLFAWTACVGTAALLSLLNVGLVLALRVSAIIVTLGALAAWRGLALIVAEIGIPEFNGGLTVSAPYAPPGSDHANAIVFAATVFVLVFARVAKTPRTWIALGDSLEAARLQGLRPGRVLTSSFAAGGVLLGLSALVHVTQLGTIEPARLARGFELRVVGAVVLGGTNIFGGEASWLGTALGVLLLHFLDLTLVYAGVNPYWREVIVGAAILVVIGADCFLHREAKRLREVS